MYGMWYGRTTELYIFDIETMKNWWLNNVNELGLYSQWNDKIKNSEID